MNETSHLGWSSWDYTINGWNTMDLWIIGCCFLVLAVPIITLIKFYAKRGGE